MHIQNDKSVSLSDSAHQYGVDKSVQKLLPCPEQIGFDKTHHTMVLVEVVLWVDRE